MIRTVICVAILAALFVSPVTRAQAGPAVPPAAAANSGQAGATALPAAPLNLTLPQAEQVALKNHPRLQEAKLSAAVAGEVVTEVRSAYYPTISANFTGVMAEADSRIAAGALNNPIIYDRYSNGLELDQLVTDFGRTHNLVASSRLKAQAAQSGVEITRADVLLQVDSAYFSVLRSLAVLNVAQQTVQERQTVVEQVSTLTANKLKSGLDLSFAQVTLSQAELLLTQATNDLQSSYADLSTALGYADQQSFNLAEEAEPAEPLSDVGQAVTTALQNRPELAQQGYDVEAAKRFATAERDLYFPTLSLLGDAGITPYRQDELLDRYAAVGFNLNLPIFEGHLFGARRAAAELQAQGETQALRDLKDRIVRDVRRAWLNANTAYQNLNLTAELLAQADKALDLSQARYKLGLSSIVELSQAQLNDADARIQQATAKYDYQAQVSALRYQEGLLR